jgi:hypothetical protein
MTIHRMRIACCIPKDTNTYLEYVIFIAFPLQQWFTRTLLNVTLYVLMRGSVVNNTTSLER